MVRDETGATPMPRGDVAGLRCGSCVFIEVLCSSGPLSKTGCAFAYDESIVIVRPYESEMTERPFATRKCTRPTPCTARGARALHERRRTAIARARVAQRRRHAAR